MRGDSHGSDKYGSAPEAIAPSCRETGHVGTVIGAAIATRNVQQAGRPLET
ncbi:hypothetical protein ACLI4R_03835 [Natrialbaceae archaeon A-chndr2]